MQTDCKARPFHLYNDLYNRINYSKLHIIEQFVTKTRKNKLWIICRYNKCKYVNQYIPSPAANRRYITMRNIDIQFKVQTDTNKQLFKQLELQVTSKVPILFQRSLSVSIN